MSDDRVIAPSVAARRTLARVVLERGEPFGLVAFRSADNHPHLIVLCDQSKAYELARRVEIALHFRLGLTMPFERARVRPILSQRHLYNAVHYAFRQEEHHGTAIDPYFDASNLPDLLGMRLAGAYTLATLRERLPRMGQADLKAHLGDVDLERGPMCPEVVADAAAAALALRGLAGRSPDVALARAAAVHALDGHFPAAAIADGLRLSVGRVRALRRTSPPAALVRAVQRQVRLRAAEGRRDMVVEGGASA